MITVIGEGLFSFDEDVEREKETGNLSEQHVMFVAGSDVEDESDGNVWNLEIHIKNFLDPYEGESLLFEHPIKPSATA